MRPAAKLAIAIAAALLTSPIWVFELAYLSMLPGDRPVLPATTEATPFELNALWLDAARTPSKEIAPLWAFKGLGLSRAGGTMAAERVARLWVAKERAAMRPIKRTSATLAITVWLTRHASAEELQRALAEWSYFGRGAHGIKAARNAWFGCGASASIAQDALLISFLESPSPSHRSEHPELMRKYRLQVLQSFAFAGLISRDEEATAASEDAEATVRAADGVACPSWR